MNYVVGEGWLQRLRQDHHTSERRWLCDGSVILHSMAKVQANEVDGIATEEQSHCLEDMFFAVASEYSVLSAAGPLLASKR